MMMLLVIVAFVLVVLLALLALRFSSIDYLQKDILLQVQQRALQYLLRFLCSYYFPCMYINTNLS